MCECTGPGFCNRHNMNKGQKEFEVCQTKEGFKFFEILRGNQSKPTLVQKAVNVTGAIVRDISNGMQRVSKDVEKSRLDICSSCPLFDKNRTCMSCGCFIDIKITMSSESCPEGKWLAEKTGKKCGSCGG